tara:strand:- start:6 stop:197 length:192 start_codon:yes stop_codon:yes gene_type:complete
MDSTSVLQLDQNIKLTDFLMQLANEMQQRGSQSVNFDIPGCRLKDGQREYHVLSFSVSLNKTN